MVVADSAAAQPTFGSSDDEPPPEKTEEAAAASYRGLVGHSDHIRGSARLREFWTDSVFGYNPQAVHIPDGACGENDDVLRLDEVWRLK